MLNKVLHAGPQKGVVGEEAKHPIAGVLGTLGCQEVLLGDGPDGDDIGVHVDAAVFPDDSQAGGIRADVEPVFLLTAVDLWEQVQMSPQAVRAVRKDHNKVESPKFI